jgi:hypothetical protein
VSRWTRRHVLLAAGAAATFGRAAASAATTGGPARIPYTALDRTRPVIGLYNVDDCREHGAARADQSLHDLRSWARAWGLLNLVEVGFSWPHVRSIRTGSFGVASFGLVARAPEAVAGRSFAQAMSAVLARFPDYAAVTQSTHTPCMFAPGDRDDDLGEGCTSVVGIVVAGAARSLSFGWEYESGYDAFRRTPPTLAALRAIGVVPHGRLGHPGPLTDPRPLAELMLDPDAATQARAPGESLEAYYARESLSAWCTRSAQLAMTRPNWDQPHVVVPNAKYWPVEGFRAIPDAANRLQARWLRAAGVNAVDPSASWRGYGQDAVRFLWLQTGAADGTPMRPWRRWTFPAFGGSQYAPAGEGAFRGTCVAERVDAAGTETRVERPIVYDARDGHYTLPAPPGDAVAHDTGNLLAFDVRLGGAHLAQYVDDRPTTSAAWVAAGDVYGNLRFAVPAATGSAGVTIEVTRSHNRSVSAHRIDAFSLYVGAGMPNGPIPGAPAARYPATANARLRPGFHGFMWQSGTGTLAIEALRRGAAAMIGLPASPKSFMPEPQVILRNAMLTGASIGEAHVLSPARTQHEIANAGRNVSIGLTVFGDWMYAPYARR